ncbi:MAG: ABC transporter permease [Bacteroidales bacterium]|nr:ABC transporter permease [Bacteroidales bacterium]
MKEFFSKIGRFFGHRRNWGLPYLLFMLLFVVLPLVIVVIFAFQDGSGNFTLANFKHFVSQGRDVNTFVYSIGIAILTTLICLVLGYPAAYILSNSKLCKSQVMVLLFILPMWINVLVRTLATVALFGFVGISLGEGSLIFGMVYNFLPFMIYPIYNVLKKLDYSYVEAAQDLGANPLKVLTRVLFPLSAQGVVSGVMMVFMPTISTFAISELLTLNNIKLFGTTIQENINNGMWNYGAVLALIMLVIIFITNLFNDEEDAQNEGGLL